MRHVLHNVEIMFRVEDFFGAIVGGVGPSFVGFFEVSGGRKFRGFVFSKKSREIFQVG
jgi:hypothetical protein